MKFREKSVLWSKTCLADFASYGSDEQQLWKSKTLHCNNNNIYCASRQRRIEEWKNNSGPLKKDKKVSTSHLRGWCRYHTCQTFGATLIQCITVITEFHRPKPPWRCWFSNQSLFTLMWGAHRPLTVQAVDHQWSCHICISLTVRRREEGPIQLGNRRCGRSWARHGWGGC